MTSDRAAYSTMRLDQLRSSLGQTKSLRRNSKISVFAVGSYGRLEASEFSDLDLFFLHLGSSIPSSRLLKKMGHQRGAQAKKDVIDVGKRLEFPEFTRDGEYLKVHYVQDVIDAIGSQNDDFNNHFTVRLLLLLESRPVWNDAVYAEAVGQIIEAYYRDFHDHHAEFQPIFLINDIIRYWRTLCLNYEHRRDRRKQGPDARSAKTRSHVKNLKLGFARLLTCYSAVIAIASRPGVVKQADVATIFRMTPTQRLQEIARLNRKLQPAVDEVLLLYDWFLEKMGQPTKQLNEWIENDSSRKEAFKQATRFKESVYRLLKESVDRPEIFRVLVI